MTTTARRSRASTSTVASVMRGSASRGLRSASCAFVHRSRPSLGKVWNHATAFGPSAPQPPPLPGSIIAEGELRTDEDCLFLNVYTPKADGVMSPRSGADPRWRLHDGLGRYVRLAARSFAARDVVVVTLNYRLGVLGWLALDHLDPGLAGSGNNGLRDQIEALRWVRYNIGSFGGDPDNVTIFGESAGGGSIAALLGAPDADGLYHKAIIESGPVRAIACRPTSRICSRRHSFRHSVSPARRHRRPSVTSTGPASSRRNSIPGLSISSVANTRSRHRRQRRRSASERRRHRRSFVSDTGRCRTGREERPAVDRHQRRRRHSLLQLLPTDISDEDIIACCPRQSSTPVLSLTCTCGAPPVDG